jgi:HlyD family secretion protein
MKMKKKKLLIGGAILVVLILVIANLIGGGKKAIEVQAEPVKLRDVVEEVSASGWIQPKMRVNITAEVNAEILAVPVKEGETVDRGQLLIQLDTVQLQKDVENYRYALNELRARTEAAKASFLQAEEEYNRQKKLYDQELTSETVFKNTEYAYLSGKYNYEAMLSQTKQGEALSEKAVDNLGKTRIVAPMDGVITYLNVEVGEIAQAQTAFTQGMTLMTISNLAAFEVEVDVDETEITKIRIGQNAKIEADAFPDSVFKGEVIEIGNTAVRNTLGQDQSTNFKVKVLFSENNQNIRPGMSATVDIETNRREKALSVPYGSIVMRSPQDTIDINLKSNVPESGDIHAAEVSSGDSEQDENKEKEQELKGVFVLKDGKARFIAVETGIADQKSMEILSGLTNSDSVITGPFKTLRTLKNGEDIKVQKQIKPETNN